MTPDVKWVRPILFNLRSCIKHQGGISYETVECISEDMKAFPESYQTSPAWQSWKQKLFTENTAKTTAYWSDEERPTTKHPKQKIIINVRDKSQPRSNSDRLATQHENTPNLTSMESNPNYNNTTVERRLHNQGDMITSLHKVEVKHGSPV